MWADLSHWPLHVFMHPSPPPAIPCERHLIPFLLISNELFTTSSVCCFPVCDVWPHCLMRMNALKCSPYWHHPHSHRCCHHWRPAASVEPSLRKTSQRLSAAAAVGLPPVRPGGRDRRSRRGIPPNRSSRRAAVTLSAGCADSAGVAGIVASD